MPATAEHNGRLLPVPFINIAGEFLAFDDGKVDTAIAEHRCHVCGQTPADDTWFAMRHRASDLKTMLGTPLCRRCVTATIRLCPHFAVADATPVIHQVDFDGFYNGSAVTDPTWGSLPLGEWAGRSWSASDWLATQAATTTREAA